MTAARSSTAAVRHPRPAGSPLRFGYVCGAPRVTRDPRSGSVGPRAHVTGFLDGLAANGVDTHLYLAGEDRGVGSYAEGASTRRRSAVEQVVVDLSRIGFRFETRRRARSVLGDVDIVYERLATFNDVGAPFRRRGVPWVVESNGPFWYEASAERANLALVGSARRTELACYRRADLVVAVSESLKSVLVQAAGIPEDSVVVVPNGTDPARFDPAGVVPRRLQYGFVIGFVGYVVEWAGLDLLLSTIATTRATGTEVSAVVVGDGPALDALRRQAAELGVADHVTFTGRVPWGEVPAHIAGFDAAFSGQRVMNIGAMYHSPQKLYEYQAMGVPVVASDHPDARALVTSGAGWLFDPDDAPSLAHAIERSVAEADDRDSPHRARQNVLDHHSWTARVDRLLDLLVDRDLLPARRRA